MDILRAVGTKVVVLSYGCRTYGSKILLLSFKRLADETQILGM
jgi:hypothetical protein